MKSRRINALAAVTLVVSLGMSVVVLRSLDNLRADATVEEVLYIPSAKVLKRASLGYDGLLADIYWTRVVQYFGNLHHQRSTRYDLLYPLLDITTTLDPNLTPAYQFGAIFLTQGGTEGAGQSEKAIQIVNRGIAANPHEWRLYYNLGFIYYDMNDYVRASRAFGAGAQIPGANPYLNVLQASMLERGASPETARLLWQQIYETTEDKSIRAGALVHLIALQIDQDVPALAKLAAAYREQMGHAPTSFREMVAAGWLKGFPVDPTGDTYQLLSDGRVEIVAPERKPLVRYGLPGGPQGPEELQAPETAAQ